MKRSEVSAELRLQMAASILGPLLAEPESQMEDYVGAALYWADELIKRADGGEWDEES